MSGILKIGSPQLMGVYRELLANSGSTARELADRLGLAPNVIYRNIERLEKLGLAGRSGSYPMRFTPLLVSSATGSFLLEAQRNFEEEFASGESKNAGADPHVSFLRTRSELISKTNQDMTAAKKEVNFIVSGLEVPAETILAYKKAADRGVKIKVLLQKRHDTSRRTLERWQRIGIEAKLTGDMRLRVFVFDSEIVYLTSYDQATKEEAMGVRFNYQPIALLMNSHFKQKWQVGTPLSSFLS